MKTDLERSVEIVGKAWKESAYYDIAEKFIFRFWEADSVYRACFVKLDPRNLVELACGHGRHAEQVAGLAGHLSLIDIHQENLDACRKRLEAHSGVSYHKGNGYDFQPLADSSATGIFCYDSMVHFSPDLVASYLLDTTRVLAPGGMALYHHSNYDVEFDGHYGQNPHARNSMSLERFGRLAGEAGLEIVQSEAVPWGGVPMLDGLTLVRRPA